MKSWPLQKNKSYSLQKIPYLLYLAQNLPKMATYHMKAVLWCAYWSFLVFGQWEPYISSLQWTDWCSKHSNYNITNLYQQKNSHTLNKIFDFWLKKGHFYSKIAFFFFFWPCKVQSSKWNKSKVVQNLICQISSFCQKNILLHKIFSYDIILQKVIFFNFFQPVLGYKQYIWRKK